jgi:spermidine/putrescine ABC transporter ATP-binding subunit
MAESTLSTLPGAELSAPGRRTVVEFESVTKIYPNCDDPAVADVDLNIAEGEFFSILGSSGSGKTTTLRMIAGFEMPTHGLVRLGGDDVTFVPPYRREVNTVFQNYALFPHMTVEKNVAYPLKMAKVQKAQIQERVTDALTRVSMHEYASRLPHQLSGGQRQRVALARALVGHPKLLLLDEPLGALDLKLRESMLVVLKHLQREVGITFVYVTHDQGEALAMSDRVAVMNKGHIEQIGTPTEIYSRPKTAFVANFIGKTNLLSCRKTAARSAEAGSLAINLSEDVDESTFALSIRPEDIVFGPEAEKLDNHHQGVIGDVIYFGHEQEVNVEVGGQTLTVRTRGQSFNSGETVQVGWPSKAAVIVRDGS